MGNDACARIHFDDEELQALREVIRDWINEDLVTRPYPIEIASVFRKVGVTDETGEPHPEPCPPEAEQQMQPDSATSSE